MSNYTPGPWWHDPYWNLIYDNAKCEIAAVRAAIQAGEKRARLDTARANARLIAAAPELVEALRGILGICEVSPTGEYFKADIARICQTAIAKAEGKAGA